MNYIKQLQQTNQQQAIEIEGLRAGLRDLRLYLTSSKFHTDNMVNVNDVLLRMREAEDRTQDAIFDAATTTKGE